MPDALSQAIPPDARSLARDLAVADVRSTIVDVPTVRRHKLSNTSVTAQSYVLVRARLANGAEGIGEAATLGGPRWSEESVEAIKANIDTYLAPALLGSRADQFEAAGLRMDQAAKRNNAAKAAIETALFDAVGKTFGLPAAALLGGAVRDRVPVLWTLASGDPVQEVEEASGKLETRLHRTFKVKIGALDPAADMARLRARPGTPPLLADECVFDAHDMLAVANAAAADAVSLKLVKHAGLLGVRKVAAVAEAAGIGLYGGCLLESSVGAAAHLQVFSTFRELAWGCEHFGPQILTGEYVTEPLRFEDFHVHLPTGPGIGVTLDEDRLRHYARA